MRRAERGIGLAIRKGQGMGEVKTPNYGRPKTVLGEKTFAGKAIRHARRLAYVHQRRDR